MKKAVERNNEVVEAKINFNKSEGLRMVAWRGGAPARALPLD